MKTIFIDANFKCHTTNPDGRFRAIETDSFDGYCDAYVEGFRFVPSGESWTREDGAVFRGEMVSAWKPYDELDATQREYERQLLAEYAEALRTVGVTV